MRGKTVNAFIGLAAISKMCS